MLSNFLLCRVIPSLHVTVCLQCAIDVAPDVIVDRLPLHTHLYYVKQFEGLSDTQLIPTRDQDMYLVFECFPAQNALQPGQNVLSLCAFVQRIQDHIDIFELDEKKLQGRQEIFPRWLCTTDWLL